MVASVFSVPFRRRPCFDQGMSRSSDSTPSRRAAEARFPHRIDIPVPIGGLGNRLTEMLMWCRQNIGAGMWAQHGHFERLMPRATPAVSARFYFASEADAETFRKLWVS
jgi:hypothetical protein